MKKILLILLLCLTSFINKNDAQNLYERLNPLPEYLYQKFNKMILDGTCPWRYVKDPDTKRITIYFGAPSTLTLLDMRIDGNPSFRLDSKCTVLIVPKNAKRYPMKLLCAHQEKEGISNIERIRRLLTSLENELESHQISLSM